MRAAVIREFGNTDIRVEDVATPKPRPGNVLIKILAAGVNRLDHYIRDGSISQDIPLPHVLGADAAGEVAGLGDGVTGFEIGERVIPAPGFPQEESDFDVRPVVTAPSFVLPGLGRWGTYAQYMEVPAPFVVKDDTGLSPEETATLPVALGTAVRALGDVGEVKAGDKILIQAGASGSGSMQIQVAKVLGAEVATTIRSEEKRAFVASAGADLIINTREQDLVAAVRDWTGGQGADVVIDNLGGDVLGQSIEAARPLGVIVAFGFAAGPQVSFDVRTLFFTQKQLRGSMASDPEHLAWGLEQVRAGRIRPLLDRTMSLDQATEALQLVATNQVKGNVVLLPWQD